MLTLLPYQRDGIIQAVRKYAEGSKGVLLADEMGLGKTVQAIGIINELFSLDKANVLAISPLSLKINWLREIERWGNTRASILVTHYEAIGKLIPNQGWDLLIIDEAHFVKNPASKRGQLVAKLARQAKRVLLLTGTPITNRPVELWPLLMIVDPARWDPKGEESKPPKPPPKLRPIPAHLEVNLTGAKPRDPKKPRKVYTDAFMRFAKTFCDAKLETIYVKGGRKQVWNFRGASNLDMLHTMLRGTCMIRRFKKDVLPELPAKRRQLIVIPSSTVDNRYMADLTLENYEDQVNSLRSRKVQFEEWSAIRHEQALAKVPFVVDHVTHILDETDKVIVFAHHTDVILALVKELAPLGCAVFIGDTNEEERNDAVDVFRDDPNCRIFIGSLRAAGVGITLVSSSVVIFAELDPVPAMMMQAEDRAHRIGQKDSVLVQHIVTDGTIDARMAKILIEKQAVIDLAVGGGT